jgi:hypothetical protein
MSLSHMLGTLYHVIVGCSDDELIAQCIFSVLPRKSCYPTLRSTMIKRTTTLLMTGSPEDDDEEAAMPQISRLKRKHAR